MVGKETIPIGLGKGRQRVWWWTISLASFLLISLGYVVSYYYLYRQKITGWGFLFEWIVDGSFIFAGLLGLLWSSF